MYISYCALLLSFVCCCFVVAGAPLVVRCCCLWPTSDVGDLAGKSAEEGLGLCLGEGAKVPTSLLNHTQGLAVLGGFRYLSGTL